MTKQLRILILEDSKTDADLTERELSKGGFDFISERVENRDDFLRELQDFSPDIILADYILPQFNGIAALLLAQTYAPGIPFIFVTGSMNEETAVDCMKSGADDYVIKEHLIRLIPAIHTALEKRREKGDRITAERDLRESESRYRMLMDLANDAIIVAKADSGEIIDANKKAQELLGRTLDELRNMNQIDLFPSGNRRRYKQLYDECVERGKAFFRDVYVVNSTGQQALVDISANMIDIGGKRLVQGIFRDVSSRKQIEDSLHKARESLEVRVQKRTSELAMANVALQDEILERRKAEAEISSLEKQIEFILGATKTGLDIIDAEYNIRYIDPEWQKVYGDPVGKKCYEYFMGRDFKCSECGVRKALETRKTVVTEERLEREGNRPVQVTSIPYQDEKGDWLVAEITVDITELKKSEERYQAIISVITDYIYTVTIYQGEVVNVTHDQGCVAVTGYTSEEFESDPYLWINMVIEDDRTKVQDWAERILRGEKVKALEHRIIRKDGALRWIRNIPVYKYNYLGELISYDGVVKDITDTKTAE